MITKKELIVETAMLLDRCDIESVERISKLNKILVGLSAAQMEYMLELATLLFCQPPK